MQIKSMIFHGKSRILFTSVAAWIIQGILISNNRYIVHRILIDGHLAPVFFITE